MSHTNDQRDETISGINVTPLVDVVLVLLVVLMVTATYISSKGIPLELPRAESGEAVQAPLSISIDRAGQLYLDGVALGVDRLKQQLRALPGPRSSLRVVIAADGSVEHRRVVQLIDVLRHEDITQFAINVDPGELE
ncbi:MAG: biopolymer transporter ExbD [Polyangiaceae bacterium]